MGLTSQVVAIIENIAPAPDELEHRLDVRDDRLARAPQVLVRIARAQRRRLLERQPGRDVARQRVVRRGLVGDEVEVLTARGELGHDLGRVPEQADRQRPPLAPRPRAPARARRRASSAASSR